MKIIKPSRKNKKLIIKTAVEKLRQGGLIVYPTETCYGFGVDGLNSEAVDRLLKIKGFRKGKPILIAVADKKMARKYVKINKTAENLYQNFLPGPLTVVSQSLHKTDPRLESKKGTLGIRIPDYPLVLEIIKKFNRPITSTSANTSGGNIPYSIKDALSQLSEKKKKMIDLIIDAGRLPRRPPSSVVETTPHEPILLRQGEIDFSQLKTKTVITNSPEETINLGQELVKKRLKKNQPLIFALQGELGAGKTQLAKGIGLGLGIKQTITSPTFVIIKEYPFSQGTFFHLDAWRVESEEELLKLGIEKMVQNNNVLAIEWIQKSRKSLEKIIGRKNTTVVYISVEHLSENSRRIKFT